MDGKAGPGWVLSVAAGHDASDTGHGGDLLMVDAAG